MPNRKYNIGDRIGRLTILSDDGYDEANKLMIICSCDCGNTKRMRLNNFGRKTTSCGCYKAESIRARMGKPLEHLATVEALNECKRRTKDTDLTFEKVNKLIFSNCFYCEKTPNEVGNIYRRPIKDGRELKKIGIDRVKNEIGYYINNVVPCCTVCNYIKRNHGVEDLINRMEVFLKNLKKLTDFEGVWND